MTTYINHIYNTFTSLLLVTILHSYLINLVQLMLHKNEGQRICESSCVDRLVEIRTVLEKIRPLDQKLRYQVDKLLKTAATGFAG